MYIYDMYAFRFTYVVLYLIYLANLDKSKSKEVEPNCYRSYS
jgi:hypothetical protein